MRSPMSELPLTHVPVNREAALATARGEHWEWKNKATILANNGVHQDTPPPIQPLPKNASTLPDLTGVSFGRFRVIGFARDRRSKWVVRCVCGIYEMRTTKAIRNPLNSTDRCRSCRHVDYLSSKRGQTVWNPDLQSGE